MLTRGMSNSTKARGAPPSKKLDGHRVVKSSRRKQAPQRSTRTKSTSTPSGIHSRGWTSGDGVNEIILNKINNIYNTANWEFLCSDAVKCHRRQSAAPSRRQTSSVTCEIQRDRFAFGAHHLVLEASFSDSTYWIVRIRFPVAAAEESRVEMAMLSEVATMRLVQERTSIPVPTVFGYNAKQENPFGYQYMFMSVLPGRHLDNSFGTSVPQQHQAKVADQFAEILHELSTKMTFDRIGRVWCGENNDEEPSIISFDACGSREGKMGWYPIGPFSTSLEYFYALRQHENDAIRAGVLNGILGQDEDHALWFTACRIFEHALCSFVCMEKMTGPFPLEHRDLHFNNILLDDDFNVTGVIDWSSAQTVPCESFYGGLELIVSPGVTKEKAARYSSFRDMVRSAWEKKYLKKKKPNSAWSMSENVGSKRAEMMHYSYTFGSPRRTVAYAQIVTGLLFGPEFSLENFKGHLGTS
jgi:isoamyl acetate esterase